jgi:hypothetical protein
LIKDQSLLQGPFLFI